MDDLTAPGRRTANAWQTVAGAAAVALVATAADVDLVPSPLTAALIFAAAVFALLGFGFAVESRNVREQIRSAPQRAKELHTLADVRREARPQASPVAPLMNRNR